MTPSGPVPCTANQLMVARLRDKGHVSSIPFLLRAKGPLRIDILRDALQLVVDRHEILRSVFRHVGGELVQQPVESPFVRLPLTDLSDAPDPLALALAGSAAEGRKSFALEDDLRLRANVFRLAADDHLVSVVVDHLAADGYSLGIIGADWRSYYQVIEAGTPFEVPLVAPQYRAYALWQRLWLAGDEAARLREQWLAELEDLAPSVTSSSASSPAVEMCDFDLNAAASKSLSTLGIRFKITPFMVVAAVYAPLLVSVTGERDMIVGTVRANRRRSDAQSTVGHFANLVPLRVRIDLDSTGESWLREMAATCRAAYAREELPFSDAAAAAWSRHRISAAHLARDAINFMPFATAPVAWGGALTMEQVWGPRGERPLAIGRATLFLRHHGSSLGGTLVYNPDAVDPAWGQRFPQAFSALLTALCSRGRQTLRELLVASGYRGG